LAIIFCQAKGILSSASDEAEGAQDGPFDIANRLLVDREKSLGYEKIMEAARQLSNESQVLEVKQVFQELLAKRYMYKGSCGKDAIDELIAVRNMMIENSKKDPFAPPQSKRRLNNLLILNMNFFFKVCIETYHEEWLGGEVEVFFDEKGSVTQFIPGVIPCFQTWPDDEPEDYCDIWFDRMDNIFSRPFSPKWVSLFDHPRIPTYEIDPYTGKFVVSDDHMMEIYQEFVSKPCKVLLDKAKVLSSPVHLLSNYSRNLATSILRKIDSQTPLKSFMDKAIEYAVCQRLQHPNSTHLSDFANFFNRADQETLYEKMEKATLPYQVENFYNNSTRK